MTTGIVLCLIVIVWIIHVSTEPCAHDVRLIRNQTGYYVTWSRLGQECGDTWFLMNDQYKTLVTPPLHLQYPGTSPQVVCRGEAYCDPVTDIVVSTEVESPTTRSPVVTSQSTTRTPVVTSQSTTRTLVGTSQSLNNVPNTNKVTSPTTSSPLVSQTSKNESDDEFPTLLVVVSVVCAVAVLTLVAILVVCIIQNRRSRRSGKTTAPAENNTRSLRREDIQHIVSSDKPRHEEGGTYDEIGEVSHIPRDRDEYAVVVKSHDRSHTTTVTGDTYAVVQKSTKEADHAVDPGSMYAEVQKPSKAAKEPMLKEDTNRPNQNVSRHKNKDGLIYLDVDFSQNRTSDQTESARPLLDDPKSDCEYAEVQHA